MDDQTDINNISQTFYQILNDIASIFIKWPNKDEAKKDAKEFQKFGNFPAVIGATDGCHIKKSFRRNPSRLFR